MTAVVVFPCLVAHVILDLGLVRADPNPLGLMSPGILAFAWAMSLPFVAAELWLAPSRSRWVTRGLAFAGTAPLAVVGSLPVTLQFEADPITHAEVRSAVSNYLVLLVGYLVLIAGVNVWIGLIRRGVPHVPR